MFAFVKLLITFSISMYIMCVKFVQHFELQSRLFTDFHYCLLLDSHLLDRVHRTVGHFHAVDEGHDLLHARQNVDSAGLQGPQKVNR